MKWFLNWFRFGPKTSVQYYEGMGRGVRAERNFGIGDIVEVSPVVIVNKYECHDLNETILNLYRFEWSPKPAKDTAIALGIGSLFNHSKQHNVTYVSDITNNNIVFTATRKIKKGEQLFINYGYDPVFQWKHYLGKVEHRRMDEEERSKGEVRFDEDKELKEA
jgi:hypothetical protein